MERGFKGQTGVAEVLGGSPYSYFRYEAHLAKIEEESRAKLQATIDEGRRIARDIQEKARELAVLETMDGGKTIKESRDVD